MLFFACVGPLWGTPCTLWRLHRDPHRVRLAWLIQDSTDDSTVDGMTLYYMHGNMCVLVWGSCRLCRFRYLLVPSQLHGSGDVNPGRFVVGLSWCLHTLRLSRHLLGPHGSGAQEVPRTRSALHMIQGDGVSSIPVLLRSPQ